jgi:soluble lytic murein transglycosylase-like protein
VSPRGAYGFMQVMPSTDKLYNKALQLDTLKLDDNEKNIYIGMHILKDMYDYWISKGKPDSYSRKLSLACYNAGIGTVLYYNGIPPYKETIGYIRFILKEHSIITDLSTDNYLANK